MKASIQLSLSPATWKRPPRANLGMEERRPTSHDGAKMRVKKDSRQFYVILKIRMLNIHSVISHCPILYSSFPLNTQSLPATLALNVQIRRLAQAADPITCPSRFVVIRSAVKSRPVIPDGTVILAPAIPHLRVVVLRHQVEEIVEKHIALVFRDAVDALGEAPVDKHRLPPGYGVGSDDGVDGCEVAALVQWRTADALAERVSKTGCLVVEEGGIVSSSQAFEELLHWLGKAVINLVARGPELYRAILVTHLFKDKSSYQQDAYSITSGSREGVDLEHGVI